jgi:hypothetical protein
MAPTREPDSRSIAIEPLRTDSAAVQGNPSGLGFRSSQWNALLRRGRRNVPGYVVQHYLRVVRIAGLSLYGSRASTPKSDASWIRGSLLASGAVVPFDSEPVIYPLYAHLLRRPAVVRGQPVSYGQLVGLTGSSGNAGGTTPHLHFEFRERPGDGAKYYLPGLFGRIDPQVIYGEPPLTSPAHATPTPVCRGGQAGFRKSRPPESPKTSQAETSGPSGAGNPFFGHFWS